MILRVIWGIGVIIIDRLIGFNVYDRGVSVVPKGGIYSITNW